MLLRSEPWRFHPVGLWKQVGNLRVLVVEVDEVCSLPSGSLCQPTVPAKVSTLCGLDGPSQTLRATSPLPVQPALDVPQGIRPC